jgi:transcriptional regulator GlxA family with amidase domain
LVPSAINKERQMIIGIPVYQHVDLLDVTAPHEVLKWMDPKLDLRLIAESTEKPIVTRDGFRFLATHDFNSTPRLDVLWVPGGDPEKALAPIMGGDVPDYINFLKRTAATADWVCSVCEGALLLAAAGLLDGYQATTHWEFTPCLKEFKNVIVVDGHPRFVQDRNRLTGGGISSGLDEALRLVELLKGTKVAQEVQQSLQYYPRPPVDSEIPAPDDPCFFSWKK